MVFDNRVLKGWLTGRITRHRHGMDQADHWQGIHCKSHLLFFFRIRVLTKQLLRTMRVPSDRTACFQVISQCFNSGRCQVFTVASVFPRNSLLSYERYTINAIEVGLDA